MLNRRLFQGYNAVVY